MKHFKGFLTVLALVLAFSHLAAAQTTHCTQITSVPYGISNSGVYCLVNNVFTTGLTGSAITISASNVVLDFNGFTLGQNGGTGNTATGISASSQKNVTIRNGAVRGFYVGVSLYDSSPFTTSSGYVVENMLVMGSTYTGIQAYGLGSVVRNNQVLKTGGSTYTAGTNGNANGIEVTGLGSEVSNNLVVS